MSIESKIALELSKKYFEVEEHTKITDEFVKSLGIANQIKDFFIVCNKIRDTIAKIAEASSGELTEDAIYQDPKMYVEVLNQNGISKDDIYRSALIQNGLCGIDCTSLDFSDLSPESFRMLTFDTKTVFSPEQESTFQPILEKGKNFGLGIDESGLSGEGVHIAIIDRAFREEIDVDNLILEDGVVDENEQTDYHGISTTSLLASRNCGIAKDATIHFYRGGGERTLRALDKIMESNNNPNNPNKITIVSGSWRIKDEIKFEEYRAKLDEQGCDLICANVFDKYFHPVIVDENGEIVDDLLPADSEIDYICGQDEQARERFLAMKSQREGNIKVPINRTYHQEEGGYRYQASYSTSWCIPEIAGLFALCKEKNPNIRLVDFIATAKIVSGNGLINPKEILENIERVMEIRQDIQHRDSYINFDDLISNLVEKCQGQDKAKGTMNGLTQQALEGGVTDKNVGDANRTEERENNDRNKGDIDDK